METHVKQNQETFSLQSVYYSIDLIDVSDAVKCISLSNIFRWVPFTSCPTLLPLKLLTGYPDNHDGVITHLEPDILESKVRWAFGSITTNKDRNKERWWNSSWAISSSIKIMLLKCCTQYASKFGKLSSGHSTVTGQFSFQSQRIAMPKNAQTTHTHTIALISQASQVMLKIL